MLVRALIPWGDVSSKLSLYCLTGSFEQCGVCLLPYQISEAYFRMKVEELVCKPTELTLFNITEARCK